MIKIAPSILASDFANLQSEIESINNADFIHIDVMDGIFVPNISIGIPVVQSIRKVTDIPFDVHLMIENPLKYIEDFINAGADILTIHYESSSDIEKSIKTIKNKGCKAAISIKPNTSPEVLFPFLDLIDMALVMTVEPGFGGQKLITDCLNKISILKNEINKRNLNVLIEADGGITSENLLDVKKSGVDIAVIGSAIFKNENRMEIIEKFKNIDKGID